MRGNAHVRFGGRLEETERPKDRHRASGPPNHVVQLARRAVDDVRRPERNAAGKSKSGDGRWVKSVRWSLLKAPERQTVAQLAALHEVERANKRLYRAFLLKEELRLLYHLDDRSLAEAHLA